MQHAPAQDQQNNLEMSLREHLLAASASGSGPPPYPASAPPPQPAGDHTYQPSGSASPHDQYDSNAGQQQPYAMGANDSAGDDGLSPDARKGKRELSTSKRAAQNRAAQRAFRQRKEGYIKKLEEQVKEFQSMETNYRVLQNENYQLREYILNLQSRLLENQSDFPPAPSHVDLSAQRLPNPGDAASPVEEQLRREMQHQAPPEAPMRHDAMSQLQAAAAQASEARPHEGPYGLVDHPPSKRAKAGEDAPSAGDKANT